MANDAHRNNCKCLHFFASSFVSVPCVDFSYTLCHPCYTCVSHTSYLVLCCASFAASLPVVLAWCFLPRHATVFRSVTTCWKDMYHGTCHPHRGPADKETLPSATAVCPADSGDLDDSGGPRSWLIRLRPEAGARVGEFWRVADVLFVKTQVGWLGHGVRLGAALQLSSLKKKENSLSKRMGGCHCKVVGGWLRTWARRTKILVAWTCHRHSTRSAALASFGTSKPEQTDESKAS